MALPATPESRQLALDAILKELDTPEGRTAMEAHARSLMGGDFMMRMTADGGKLAESISFSIVDDYRRTEVDPDEPVTITLEMKQMLLESFGDLESETRRILRDGGPIFIGYDLAAPDRPRKGMYTPPEARPRKFKRNRRG